MKRSTPVPSSRSIISLALTLASGTTQANETTSYGVFAQSDWNITDALTLTVGARYTYEEKDACNVGVPDGAFAILAPYDVEMSDSWSAFTPKVALNYAISDALSAYATVSTGFKSGGYQGMAPTAAVAFL